MEEAAMKVLGAGTTGQVISMTGYLSSIQRASFGAVVDEN
jgi:hypothetical protein